MPYSQQLAERIRHRFSHRQGIVEKKMFGGVGFLLHGNMCVGVWKESLIARVGLEQYDDALQESFAREFDITGRPMRGWVMVSPAGIGDDGLLGEWIDRALKFVQTLPRKQPHAVKRVRPSRERRG